MIRPERAIGRCGEIKDRQLRSPNSKKERPNQEIPIIDESIEIEKESSIKNQGERAAHNKTGRTLLPEFWGSLAGQEGLARKCVRRRVARRGRNRRLLNQTALGPPHHQLP
jgi:hypothetical protein